MVGWQSPVTTAKWRLKSKILVCNWLRNKLMKHHKHQRRSSVDAKALVTIKTSSGVWVKRSQRESCYMAPKWRFISKWLWLSSVNKPHCRPDEAGLLADTLILFVVTHRHSLSAVSPQTPTAARGECLQTLRSGSAVGCPLSENHFVFPAKRLSRTSCVWHGMMNTWLIGLWVNGCLSTILYDPGIHCRSLHHY